jgi:type IV pilus biogenesis protein PilP
MQNKLPHVVAMLCLAASAGVIAQPGFSAKAAIDAAADASTDAAHMPKQQVSSAVADTLKAVAPVSSLSTATSKATPASGSSRTPRRAKSSANSEASEVASNDVGVLTRRQQEIETLKKEDEAAGVRLSIQEKRTRARQLSSTESNNLKGTFRVMSIEGPNSALTATIRYASGEEVEVRRGDVLSDGRMVSQVASSGITMGTGRAAHNVPLTVTSGKALPPAQSPSLPAERIMVPMGGVIPSPAGVTR